MRFICGKNALFERLFLRVEPNRRQAGVVRAEDVGGEAVADDEAALALKLLYQPPYEFEIFAFGLSQPPWLPR